MFKKIVTVIPLILTFLLFCFGCGTVMSTESPSASASAAPDATITPCVVNTASPWISKAWYTKAAMPTARKCEAVAVGGRIYTVSANAAGNYTVEEYDIANDAWVRKNGVSSSANSGEIAVASVNGKLYVIGGYYNKKASNVLEEYDPATDTWTRRADMPIAKDCLGSAVFNGKIYAMGGSVESGASLEVEVYDPVTDTWTVKAKMLKEKIEPAVAVLGEKIYIAAGGLDSTSMEEYDPVSDKWTKKVELPSLRASFSFEEANGRIYAIGGCIYANGNIKSVVRSVDEYDPASDTWTVKGERPGENWLMATAAYDNQIYVMGGMIGKFPDGELQDVLQVYDPLLDN